MIRRRTAPIIYAICIIVVLVISLWPNTSNAAIRYSGLFLQLLGIGTVVLDVHNKLAFFGRSFLRMKKTIDAKGKGSMPPFTGRASGYLTEAPCHSLSVEDRITTLEKDVTLIHERITSNERSRDEQFDTIIRNLKCEELTRDAGDSALHSNLEKVATDGSYLIICGTVCLGLGVVLSTISPEIEKLKLIINSFL